MKYTLYLRTADGDHFLQKADTEEELERKSHATIQRWIGQMNLVVKNASQTMLVIAKGDWGIKEARYIAGGRRVWRKYTDLNEMRIRHGEPTKEAAPASVSIGASIAQALGAGKVQG